MDIALQLLPAVGTIVGTIVVLFVVHRILERSGAAASGSSPRNQLLMLGITAAGLLVLVMVLPIGDTKRGHLLQFAGILLGAAVALSSTTFLGNTMAGIMLRAVRNYRMGDFIRCGEHLGRVSERGLFHTEIQTEDRDLTTLPNLYLVTHPVTTIRASGTIVSATVSLGYDVSRNEIERLLLDAATAAELREPFVRVLELGDFAVTYRIAGLLTEVKQYLTARSRLCGKVMDALHNGGVEIVSPSFMNTRGLPEDKRFIPRRSPIEAPAQASTSPEEVVFDRADEAESLESLREAYLQARKAVEELKAQVKKTEEESERKRLEAELSRMQRREEDLKKIIIAREAKAESSS